MTLNAKAIQSTSGNFKRPPALEAGNYPARVVQIIDLGIQPQRPFKGQEKPPKPEIYVTYELLDEFLLDEDGEEIEDRPRWISETIPMNPLNSELAKSTKRYVALDPELKHDGDWSKLIGTPCMVTIVANPAKDGRRDEEGNVVVYNNVAGVQAMRKKDAAKAKELVNEPKVFDMSDPDLDVFSSLPDWLKDKIKGALDFEGSALDVALGGEPKEAVEEVEEDEDW